MVFARVPREALNVRRVVTIGGGTGPFAILSSLKHTNCAITAIVSMADSGGSSRRLMDEFGELPLGDLRQALVALSRHGVLWRDVFMHRFPKAVSETANGVSGHSLGNLVISALREINNGDLLSAIRDAQELLGTAGDVSPITEEHTTLWAELADGTTVEGETNIDLRGSQYPGAIPPITRVYLDHPTKPCNQALQAIRRADVIIIGPGDLYTSIIPNLLVENIAHAIHESEAEKVYICNLMTKHGETDGYRASDFVAAVHRYLQGGRVDRAIVHDGQFTEPMIAHYAEQGQHPVEADGETVRLMGLDVMVEHLIAPNAEYARHDPKLLVRAILSPYLPADLLVPSPDTDR